MTVHSRKKMDSAKQEQLVAAVAKNMAAAHEGVANVEIRRGSKNRIPGASGFRHQIDVSVHTQSDLILYECKYWNANVDADAILAFAARGIDIQRAHPRQLVALNIVVRHDLTRGAKRLAEAFKIQHQVARSAAEFSLGYKADRAAAVVDRARLTESAEARLYPK